MHPVQFQAYCQQAVRLWAQVDAFELERRCLERRLRGLEADSVWTTRSQRRLLDAACQTARKSLTSLQEQLSRAKLKALRAAERATQLAWGVRLGHQYRVQRDGAEVAQAVRIDYLRPSHGELGCFLCLGQEGSVTHLFVLGREDLRFEACGPDNLVALQAYRVARKPL